MVMEIVKKGYFYLTWLPVLFIALIDVAHFVVV